jgi:hypothetical protein
MDVEKVLLKIMALDLGRVKKKLMQPSPEGEGWSAAQADEAEV